MNSKWKDLESQYWRRMRCCMHCHHWLQGLTLTYPHFPGWILCFCFGGPSNSTQSCFHWRVWVWHAYFSEDFSNISLTFPLLMQLPARYWTWFNLVYLVRCIQLNHLEYPALFTTHLYSLRWYVKENMLWKREVCFTSRHSFSTYST